jgi:hypothetical protein
VNCGIALDAPHHLGHRIFRRNGNQHVNVVGHQVTLFNPTLFLLGQGPKHLTQVLAQLRIESFAAVFRDEHHMVFALYADSYYVESLKQL